MADINSFEKLLCLSIAILITGLGVAMGIGIQDSSVYSLFAADEMSYGVNVENSDEIDLEAKNSDKSDRSEKNIDGTNKSGENLESNRSDFNKDEEAAYSQGYEDGYEIGERIAREETSERVKPYNPEASTKDYNGSLKIEGYTFVNGEIEGEFSGISWPENDTIKLEISDLQTAGQLETMCDHEVAHQLFPGFEHSEEDNRESDPIYRYSDDMEIKACDILAEKLSA